MKVGLTGLPGSGVTTLFCIFTERDYAAIAQGGKPAVAVGETRVPDARVQRLAEIYNPRKTTLAVIEFADVPVELAPGGSFAPGTVNALRGMDAVAVVLRAFDNPVAPFARDGIDPLRDIRAAHEEALLTDLIQVEKRLERLAKEHQLKSLEAQTLEEIKAVLDASRPIREMNLSPDAKKRIAGYRFLTEKPWLVLLNTGAEDIDLQPVVNYLDEADFPWLKISGRMELEIADLEPEERAEFLEDLGVKTDARQRFIRGAYAFLDLISFLTVGEDECRAWSVRNGSTMVEAAAKIHSDIARGFIRAEVVAYEDFIRAGSMAEAKKAGKVRLEGKQSIVQDGDIISFRFNV